MMDVPMFTVIVAMKRAHVAGVTAAACLEVINTFPQRALLGAHWEMHEAALDHMSTMRMPQFPDWSPYETNVRTGDGKFIRYSLWGYPITTHDDATRPMIALVSAVWPSAK